MAASMIFRIGFEFHLHLADGFDATGRVSRASQRGWRRRRVFWDRRRGRGAVGGADAEEEAGAIGGEGVAFGLIGGRGFCARVEDTDYIGVDLMESDEV